MQVSAFDAIGYRQDQLRKIFDAVETLPIGKILNSGQRRYDVPNRVIFNDTAWKGYFPVGSVLNEIARRVHSSFRKRFFRQGDQVRGITTDSDFFIEAHNTVEEVTLSQAKGSLQAGKYLLLKYEELKWRGFHDVIKAINENLLIGKVFTGLPFPRGTEVFTFTMVREYSFDEMTVEDHRALFDGVGVAPGLEPLAGTWAMNIVANNSQRADTAQLQFDVKPEGKIEARYLLMRTLEGQSRTEMKQDELMMYDFTPFHDEIRALDANYMLGKWITGERKAFGPFSLGLLQAEAAGEGKTRFGFYYTLKRSETQRSPATAVLDKLLSRKTGVGMTFEEQMDGAYYPGDSDKSKAHLESLDPKRGKPIQFKLKMKIENLDAFVDSVEHQTELSGTIQFADLNGDANVELPLQSGSIFQYAVLNPATQEHEMRYHIRFAHKGTPMVLSGTKFLQKDRKGDFAEVLYDFTTLFVEVKEEATGKVNGVALMKFRTFESLTAAASLLQFGTSFQVTGTNDAVVEAAAFAKFNAMTTKFIFQEYNPLQL
jgi:hypothetical protein